MKAELATLLAQAEERLRAEKLLLQGKPHAALSPYGARKCHPRKW